MTDPLARMADAFDRLAPPPLADDRAASALVWHANQLRGVAFEPLPLDLLTGIDDQKAPFVENLRRHARGHAAHDMLLWGARGSGKSALVKAAVGAVQAEGLPLALVEVGPGAIATLPELFERLGDEPRRVVVFLDDIGFEGDMAAARALRSLLDGGSSARPGNVRLAVTSNRRHLVARDMSEQDSAINVRDVVDDRLALADRFGLSLGFHVADQPTYLAMVEAYATRWNLPFDPHDAVRFATQRGSRSGRVAWHYIVELAGRAGRSLDGA